MAGKQIFWYGNIHQPSYTQLNSPEYAKSINGEVLAKCVDHNREYYKKNGTTYSNDCVPIEEYYKSSPIVITCVKGPIPEKPVDPEVFDKKVFKKESFRETFLHVYGRLPHISLVIKNQKDVNRIVDTFMDPEARMAELYRSSSCDLKGVCRTKLVYKSPCKHAAEGPKFMLKVTLAGKKATNQNAFTRDLMENASSSLDHIPHSNVDVQTEWLVSSQTNCVGRLAVKSFNPAKVDKRAHYDVLDVHYSDIEFINYNAYRLPPNAVEVLGRVLLEELKSLLWHPSSKEEAFKRHNKPLYPTCEYKVVRDDLYQLFSQRIDERLPIAIKMCGEGEIQLKTLMRSIKENVLEHFVKETQSKEAIDAILRNRSPGSTMEERDYLRLCRYWAFKYMSLARGRVRHYWRVEVRRLLGYKEKRMADKCSDAEKAIHLQLERIANENAAKATADLTRWGSQQRMLTFDIETNYTPNSRNDIQEIILIHTTLTNGCHTKAIDDSAFLYLPKTRTAGGNKSVEIDMDQITGLYKSQMAKYSLLDAPINVYQYTSEAAMLTGFIEHVRKCRPSVIASYNGTTFDIPMVVLRMEELRVDGMKPYRPPNKAFVGEKVRRRNYPLRLSYRQDQLDIDYKKAPKVTVAQLKKEGVNKYIDEACESAYRYDEDSGDEDDDQYDRVEDEEEWLEKEHKDERLQAMENYKPMEDAWDINGFFSSYIGFLDVLNVIPNPVQVVNEEPRDKTLDCSARLYLPGLCKYQDPAVAYKNLKKTWEHGSLEKLIVYCMMDVHITVLLERVMKANVGFLMRSTVLYSPPRTLCVLETLKTTMHLMVSFAWWRGIYVPSISGFKPDLARMYNPNYKYYSRTDAPGICANDKCCGKKREYLSKFKYDTRAAQVAAEKSVDVDLSVNRDAFLHHHKLIYGEVPEEHRVEAFLHDVPEEDIEAEKKRYKDLTTYDTVIPSACRDEDSHPDFLQLKCCAGRTITDVIGYYDRFPSFLYDFSGQYPGVMRCENACLSAWVSERYALENLTPDQYKVFRVPNARPGVVHDCKDKKKCSLNKLRGKKNYGRNCQWKEVRHHVDYKIYVVRREVFEGLAGMMCDQLTSMRNHYKKCMKTTKDPIEKDVFNLQQLSVKLAANSIYGIYLLLSRVIGGLITYCAREQNERATEYLTEKMGNIAMCDTDSTSPIKKSADLTKGSCPLEALSMVYTGEKWAPLSEISRLMIKEGEHYSDILNNGSVEEGRDPAWEAPASLELEKILFSLIFIQKKMYTAIKLEPDCRLKVHVAGMASKKSDKTKLKSAVQMGLLKMIAEKDYEGAALFLSDVRGLALPYLRAKEHVTHTLLNMYKKSYEDEDIAKLREFVSQNKEHQMLMELTEGKLDELIKPSYCVSREKANSVHNPKTMVDKLVRLRCTMDSTPVSAIENPVSNTRSYKVQVGTVVERILKILFRAPTDGSEEELENTMVMNQYGLSQKQYNSMRNAKDKSAKLAAKKAAEYKMLSITDMPERFKCKKEETSVLTGRQRVLMKHAMIEGDKYEKTLRREKGKFEQIRKNNAALDQKMEVDGAAVKEITVVDPGWKMPSLVTGDPVLLKEAKERLETFMDNFTSTARFPMWYYDGDYSISDPNLLSAADSKGWQSLPHVETCVNLWEMYKRVDARYCYVKSIKQDEPVLVKWTDEPIDEGVVEFTPYMHPYFDTNIAELIDGKTYKLDMEQAYARQNVSKPFIVTNTNKKDPRCIMNKSSYKTPKMDEVSFKASLSAILPVSTEMFVKKIKIRPIRRTGSIQVEIGKEKRHIVLPNGFYRLNEEEGERCWMGSTDWIQVNLPTTALSRLRTDIKEMYKGNDDCLFHFNRDGSCRIGHWLSASDYDSTVTSSSSPVKKESLKRTTNKTVLEGLPAKKKKTNWKPLAQPNTLTNFFSRR